MWSGQNFLASCSTSPSDVDWASGSSTNHKTQPTLYSPLWVPPNLNLVRSSHTGESIADATRSSVLAPEGVASASYFSTRGLRNRAAEQHAVTIEQWSNWEAAPRDLLLQVAPGKRGHIPEAHDFEPASRLVCLSVRRFAPLLSPSFAKPSPIYIFIYTPILVT